MKRNKKKIVGATGVFLAVAIVAGIFFPYLPSAAALEAAPQTQSIGIEDNSTEAVSASAQSGATSENETIEPDTSSALAESGANSLPGNSASSLAEDSASSLPENSASAFASAEIFAGGAAAGNGLDSIDTAEKLQNAVSAANNGDVIVIGADIDLSGSTIDINTPINLTFSSSGTATATLSSTSGTVFIVSASNVTLTFVDVALSGENIAEHALVMADGAEGTTLEGITATGFTDSALVLQGGSVLLTGADIAKNTGQTGAGIYSKKGDLTIEGGVVDSNTAVVGGGIYVEAGSLTLKGGAVIQNNSVAPPADKSRQALGGGIALEGTSTLLLENAAVQNNKATSLPNASNTGGYGGGIYIGPTAKVSFSEEDTQAQLLLLNEAVSGGGLYVADQQGASYDILLPASLLVSGNKTFSLSSGYGAGVYIGANHKVKVAGATFTDNKAGGGGAFLLGEDSELFISNTLMKDNTSGINGGAGIKALDGSLVEFAGGVIEYNIAEGSGAGIYAAHTIQSGPNGREIVESSTVILSGGIVRNNTATGSAAGIYGHIVIMKSGEISGNTMLSGLASAVSCYSFNMSGGLISGNYLQTGRFGGTPTVLGSCMYVGNFTMSGGKIINNIYSGTSVPAGAKVFGAIFVDISIDSYERTTSHVEVSGGEISGNNSDLGGAIAHVSYAKSQYYSLDNPALQSFVVKGGIIQNNTASSHGGAFYLSSGAATITGDAIIRGNKAEAGSGGAIYKCGGPLTISGDAVIEGNTAYNHGGALFNYYDHLSSIDNPVKDMDITVTDNARLANNVATEGSGGVLYYYNKYGGIKIKTDGAAVFANNKAGAHGGVIYGTLAEQPNYSGALYDITVEGNTKMTGNTSGSLGGALCPYNSPGNTNAGRIDKLAVGGTTEISGNQAGTNGGGIWASKLEYLTVGSGVVFKNNSAATGWHMDDTDDIALHSANIKTQAFTRPFIYGYNNYDIVYRLGEQHDPSIITIEFDLNYAGQGIWHTQEGVIGEKITKPNAPARSGYTFTGWYKDKAAASAWDFNTDTPAGYLTLYAGWKLNTPTSESTPEPDSTTEPKSAPEPSPAPAPSSSSRQTVGRTVVPAQSASVTSESQQTEAKSEAPASSAADSQAFSIGQGQVPSAGVDGSGWALVNLILTIVSVILVVLWTVGLIRNRGKDQETAESRRALVWRFLGIAVGIFMVIFFLLTQNLTLPMVFLDNWTIFMVVLLGIQLVFGLLMKRNSGRENEPYTS